MAEDAAALQERFGLTSDQSLAAITTLQVFGRVADMVDSAIDGDDPATIEAGMPNAPDSDLSAAALGAALTHLADPAVAEAVLSETEARSDQARAHALRLFTESIADLAPRSARPAVAWLRGKAHELLGDAVAAEAAFTDSNALDPGWGPTLSALARFASDRGDAATALALLRRGGIEDDHGLAGLVRQFLPDPGPTLGRNERCWCGSGRKYKVCHLNRPEQLPLERRADWLYQKACIDLTEGPGAQLVIEFARIRAAPAGGDKALQWAVQDPLIYDIALFEAGGLHDFVAARGYLLPDDEQLLAAQWELIERSVYEIVEVEPGTGMTMRDVRTGDITAVQERSGSYQVRSGQLYCAHLLPAGDTVRLFGGLEPLSNTARDELIALLDDGAGPVPLIEALSARLAPPTLHNTEGEPLVGHEATVRISDPAAITASLDRLFHRTDGGPDAPPRWVEEHAGSGLPAIRATWTLTGDELQLSANSDTRFERALATLRELDPASTLLTHQRTPVSELAPPTGSAPVQSELGSSDPAVLAAVHDVILNYEAAWLDESIPALGGLTPRQCAEDPTRRADLNRLLDSFPPDTGEPGQMSATRLRTALGLN